MLTRLFVRRSLSLTRNLGLRSYATMFGDNCPLVITPAQLHDLKAKHPDGRELVVLDASWHMPNSPRKGAEEFPRVHLPSARFLDIDAVATPHPLSVPHMMPDPATFASACCKSHRERTLSAHHRLTCRHIARLGISPESHVVLYVCYQRSAYRVSSDANYPISYDTHGVFSSPRALYMFRAFGHHRSSILDGGLPGWQAHGGATEEGQESPVTNQPEYPPPTLNKDVVKSTFSTERVHRNPR